MILFRLICLTTYVICFMLPGEALHLVIGLRKGGKTCYFFALALLVIAFLKMFGLETVVELLHYEDD